MKPVYRFALHTFWSGISNQLLCLIDKNLANLKADVYKSFLVKFLQKFSLTFSYFTVKNAENQMYPASLDVAVEGEGYINQIEELTIVILY